MPLGRCLVALVMAGLLGGLTAAAYADPPDPTWLGGYWDDSDFDNAVDFLTSASAISAQPAAEADPVLPSAERVQLRDALVSCPALQTIAFPRAPPTSASSKI